MTAAASPLRPPLFTIGYEGAALADVIARLQAAGVELLVDVRAVAASRRPGFSKTVLAASLEEAGVAYLHLRDLGTPKAGRDAARAGRTAEMRAIYAQALEEPAAVLAFERLAEEAAKRRVCLLCYEADAAGCHRRVLTERLHAALELTAQDL
jgi:uncharacterized protein (DUF488 family)